MNNLYDYLPMIITYIDKGKTVKYNFKIKIDKEFDFIITVLNKNSLEEGDVNILSESKNIPMIEKSITFRHEINETYFTIVNKNHNLIFNLTLEINMQYKYIYKDIFNKLSFRENDFFDFLIQPKLIESIQGYKQITHIVNAGINNYYESVNGLFVTQEYLREHITTIGATSSHLTLDNEVIINHNKYHPNNPIFFYFFLSAVNSYYTFEYYLTGKADLKRGEIFHAKDSTISETFFDIEQKLEDTDMLSFQIFDCENNKYPYLTITYGSSNIVNNYILSNENSHLFYLNYNLDNIKAEGKFKGNFMIYYNLYKNPNVNIGLNSNFKLELLEINLTQKIMKLNLYPYLFNDEINYKIYYAKKGVLRKFTKCQALYWIEENSLNDNIHFLNITFSESSNNPYKIEIDYSKDVFYDPLISYDFLIFAKQLNYQKSFDIYITTINKIFKNDILDGSFEKTLAPYNDIIFLYDIEKRSYSGPIYYIYFDQDILDDSFTLICSTSQKDSREEYPDLNKNDCYILREPGSSNSFLLIPKISYFTYMTITIEKKKLYSNNIKFNLIKKYKDSKIRSGLTSKKVENSFPLLLSTYSQNKIFRVLNKSLELYYTETNVNKINDKTIFKRVKSILISSKYKTITILIPLKRFKKGDIISFEFWYLYNICKNETEIISVDNNQISGLFYSNTSLFQLNLYEKEIYQNRVIHLKNIYKEKMLTNYYIINEDNIENNESIKTQCSSKKKSYLLNEKYVKTYSDYDLIYITEPNNSTDVIEYFFEVNNLILDFKNEYRILILKNKINEFSFTNVNEAFTIKIRQFSKSDLIITSGNNIYNLSINENLIEIEHKIGENSFKIENTGKGEDSYITIILYPKEIDNVQQIDQNTTPGIFFQKKGIVQMK